MRSTRSSSGCTRARARRRSSSSCPVRAAHPLANQQTLLIANALAQAQALLVGRSARYGSRRARREKTRRRALDAAVAARVCPGNRASTTILMPELNAYRLGQLLALYEHRHVRRSGALRHQPVRSVRRRARQDARRSDRRGDRTKLRYPTTPTRRLAGSSRTCARAPSK